MKRKVSDVFRELGYSQEQETNIDEFEERFQKIKNRKPKSIHNHIEDYPTFDEHMKALRR